MSVSFYLFCSETKQAVHVAEQSSGWFRGSDSNSAVGMFCLGHEGKTIECTDGDHLDLVDYDLWEKGEASNGQFTLQVRMGDSFEIHIPFGEPLGRSLLTKIEALRREVGPQACLQAM